MKILWVKAGFLHPTRGGGQIRTLETLKRLHPRHEIHFAALDFPEPGAGGQHSSEYCTRAYAIPHSVPTAGAPYAAAAFAGLFSPLPLAVLRFRSVALQRKVETLLRQERFDAVVCDFLSAAASMPDLSGVILFQHNVESIIWKRTAQHAGPLLHQLYFRDQHRRMLAYEKRVCQAVKSIVAVSEDDAGAMQSLYAAQRVQVVPTGVDLNYFTPPAARPPATTDLLFVGSMNWHPNVDGVRWFATEILPLIRRRRPECSLAIVGRRPARDISRLAEADSRIHVSGTVDDVRPYLWEAAVSIVPLRIGGGTRLKIYEAMAARIPVVSTTVGAEGLDVRDGENIALADSPAAFAERCLALLDDADARRAQSEAAWEMVSTCYSWDVAARRFEQLLV
jgi:glycosyltransferase involved in cell wall biosynthesis